MKNFLFGLLISLALLSCERSRNENDVRKIKIGATTNDLRYIMGEPWSVEVNPTMEIWYFSYNSNGYREGLHVTVKDGKVVDFYTY